MSEMDFAARTVLLSTGELGTEIYTKQQGEIFYESSPAGTTVGSNEAPILPFCLDKFTRCVRKLNLADRNQRAFDASVPVAELGTAVSVPLSLVYLRSMAKAAGQPVVPFLERTFKTAPKMPRPIFNILNGGPHAGNALEMCEYMIIPSGETIEENIAIASDVYLELQNLIATELGVSHTMVGKEGGFAPNIDDIVQALTLIQAAIDVKHKGRCDIAIDVAANTFSKNTGDGFQYTVKGTAYTSVDFLHFYRDLLSRFPSITYLEDPFNEDDKRGWQLMMEAFANDLMVVGDDLTVSTVEHIRENLGLFNSIILKVNQVGTFTGLLDSFVLSKSAGIKTIISQRSCETDSNILSHIAVGLGSDFIKAGAPARERIIKYNELIRLGAQFLPKPSRMLPA